MKCTNYANRRQQSGDGHIKRQQSGDEWARSVANQLKPKQEQKNYLSDS